MMRTALVALLVSGSATAGDAIKATLVSGVTATQVYAATQPIDVARFSFGSLNPATMTVRCRGQAQVAICTIEGATEIHPVTRMSTKDNGTQMSWKFTDIIISSIVLRME